MNCLNCGAPLELADGRTVLSCTYCESSRQIEISHDDGDRVISLRRPSGTNCPRCSCELVEASLDGRRAKLCTDCRGILIESPIFAEVARSRRAAYHGTDMPPQPVDPELLLRLIDCPNCRQPMDVHHHYGPGRAIIDSCHRCSLVWLDNSEMTSIERTPGLR